MGIVSMRLKSYRSYFLDQLGAESGRSEVPNLIPLREGKKGGATRNRTSSAQKKQKGRGGAKRVVGKKR